MLINLKVTFILAVVAVIAVSCATRFNRKPGGNQLTAATFTTVDVIAFQNIIADPDVQLLDVRTRDEFDEGHIGAATLVDVNEDDFVEKVMAVLDISRPVAVYCRSGRRSARAASLLARQGFKVTNLDGGVMAWQDAGKDLVN